MALGKGKKITGPRELPPTPEVLLSEVLCQYDLADPITCERIYAGLHEVFQIVTADGPLFLKLYRAGSRTQAEIEVETAALAHLGGRGVPVSLPLARKD